jgi:hypothetical protein
MNLRLCSATTRMSIQPWRSGSSARPMSYTYCSRSSLCLLHDVLGIVCRTEHAVAVREQLTAGRLGVADEFAHAAAGTGGNW